jgi:hypothetical protein
LAGLDLPVALDVTATMTPAGVLRSARVTLTGGPGKLPPVGPRATTLAVRQINARLESDQPDRMWSVPLARIETAGGASVELAEGQIDLAPGRVGAQGVLRIANVSGDIVSSFLPADTWMPPAISGLAPSDLALSRATVKFSARAEAQPNGAWLPRSGTASTDLQVTVHGTPLNATLGLTLPEPGTRLEVVADLAEFRPSGLGLTLPGGIATATMDFPVSLHALARATLAGGLTGASLQVHVGAGRLHAAPPLNTELPVESVELDAAYDPAARRAEIRSLKIAATGLNLNAQNLVTTLAPPYATTGQLAVDSFALPAGLAPWLQGLSPALKQAALRTVAGRNIHVKWEAVFDPVGKPALQLVHLEGGATQARLETAGGANMELADARIDLVSGHLSTEGVLRLANVPGDFAAGWLPADTWTPLAAFKLTPHDLALAGAEVRFTAKAEAGPGGGWVPQSATATANVQLRLHDTPLSASAQVTLPEPGEQLAAVVEVAEFRPSLLGLVLPGGLPSSALDFPVKLHAQAEASLAKGLRRASLQLQVGAGQLHATPRFNAEVPVESVALDAAYDAVTQKAEIRSLKVAAAGLHLNVPHGTSMIAPPYTTTGQLEVESFKLPAALAFWPQDLLPDLRRDALAALRAGDCTGVQLEWDGAFDPSRTAAPLRLTRLHGGLHLTGLELAHPEIPGPVTVAQLGLVLDYPQATATLGDVAAPGMRLSAATLELTGLDTPGPAAALTASFAADLSAVIQSWRLATPAGMLDGRASGQLLLRGSLKADAFDAQLTLDTSQARVVLPGLANIAPTAMTATLHLAGWLTTGTDPVAGFTVDCPSWLGAPLHAAGRATLAASGHRPVAFDLTAFEHGRTSLQAKMLSPAADHLELAVTGTYVDAAPWMRTALTFADAWKAMKPPPTPVATAPATVPATTVAASVSAPAPSAVPAVIGVKMDIGTIDFGDNQQARGITAVGRLENGRPVSVTFQATSAANQPLRVDLTPGTNGSQILKATVGDAAGWVRMFTGPWHAQAPAAGLLGSQVSQLMKVPTLVAGGDVTAEAELRFTDAEWLHGRLHLARATLIRAPQVLKLLALKSGKAMQTSPLIEAIDINRIALGQTYFDVSDFNLNGSGFISNLKVKTGHHDFVSNQLSIEGTYFGLGFEVSGTLGNPFIGLSDKNTLIRAFGQRNEDEFFNLDDKPAKP